MARGTESFQQKVEDNIRMDFRKTGGKVCTGCMWLRIGTGALF
jgi:hypothetical protein